jgi:hypothetical protein
MKNFVLGIVTALLMIATLAASEGGFNVVWEMEMKRPEAQKAISSYIEQHCEIEIWNWQVAALGNAIKDPDHVNAQPLNAHCFVDSK